MKESENNSSTLKSIVVQTASGILIAAIAAFLGLPEQNIDLGSLSMGLLAIPMFVLLGGVALALYLLYGVIHMVDAIATKLDVLDVDDLS